MFRHFKVLFKKKKIQKSKRYLGSLAPDNLIALLDLGSFAPEYLIALLDLGSLAPEYLIVLLDLE